MNKRIKELQNKINQARKNYYNSSPTVSDAVYDAWVDELTELDPNNPAVTQIGAEVVSEWKKINHEVPMGSLDKVNTLQELHDWIVKRYSKIKSREIFVTEKLDGISIGLTYKAGKLISAGTRGNGLQGEDILSNVRKMQGVPLSLPQGYEIDCFVRGEIILTKTNHQKYFADYANPRNAASGIAKRYDGTGSEHLTVMSYEMITNAIGFQTELDVFNTLNAFRFKTPRTFWYTINGPDDSQNFIHLANGANKVMKDYNEKLRDELPYDIDGLVVRIGVLAAQKSLGERNNKPKGAVAWKFAAAMKETTVKDIIIQVGNSGRVTPVAIVEPTHLMGATIERASLHNFSNIEKLGIDIGAKVLLKRANDVIPYVEAVTKATGTTFKAPTHCPICGEKVEFEGEFLMCLNNACPAKVKGKIKNWIKALNVLEWGDALVVGLLESGKLKTIDDLYKLTEDDLSSLPRMGEKSAKKALMKIHEGKNITLEQFVGGLSIPMIGETITGLLIDAGYDTIDKIRKCSVRDFIDVPGIGTEKAYSLHRGLLENEKLIDSLLECVDIKSRAGNLVGKTFAFTGKTENKRASLEKMVADNGGSVKSVSAGLSYLVIADPNSSSSKAVKARKLGIKLISEDDFLKMVT